MKRIMTTEMDQSTARDEWHRTNSLGKKMKKKEPHTIK
jgi:hypothetical protein